MTNASHDTVWHGFWHRKGWPFLLLVILIPIFSLFYERIWLASYPMSPTEIAYLEDPTGRRNITWAAGPDTAGRYIIKKDHRLSLGFSRSTLWIRLDLTQAPQKDEWVLSISAPWMDAIDLYIPDEKNGWRKLSTGLQQPAPFSSVTGFALDPPHPVPHSGFAYLRLQSVLALNADLRLWPEKTFRHGSQIRAYVYGGLFGIMLTMLIINSMVFLGLRDKTYIAYTLYLLCIIIHQFCLQGQILFLPTSFWPFVPMISLVVSAWVFFFGSLFCRYFLNTSTHAPAIDRILLGGQGAALVLLVMALTNQIWWGTWLTHILAAFGPVFGIAAGLQAIKRGYHPARIYLLAWMVMLLGTMAWGAWSLGWLDKFRPPQITLTVAAALESCLLTLALAERVRLVYMERQELARRERQYHQLSITDELTRLFNHRYFWDQLSGEIDQALKLGYPLSLLVMDLDDFKAINDRHGHMVGDHILNRVGELLRHNLRPADTAYRYGGEEFTVILPGANGRAAMEIAERIRRALAEEVFGCPSDPALKVTASLGATQLVPGDSTNTLFNRADRYMYRAKAKGKNKVVCGEGLPS